MLFAAFQLVLTLVDSQIDLLNTRPKRLFVLELIAEEMRVYELNEVQIPSSIRVGRKRVSQID